MYASYLPFCDLLSFDVDWGQFGSNFVLTVTDLWCNNLCVADHFISGMNYQCCLVSYSLGLCGENRVTLRG